MEIKSFIYFFLFAGMGVGTQDFVLAKKALYGLSHTSTSFCFGYYGLELFAWDGLELLSSRSQPPK
jgi:hypothetical protein